MTSLLYGVICAKSDGSNPLSSSMRALAVTFIRPDGEVVDRFSVNLRPFYTFGEPAMLQFWSDHPVQWNLMQRNTVDAHTGMQLFSRHLKRLHQDNYRIEWVASPAASNWTWFKTYYETFGDPDIKIGHFCHCLSNMIRAYTLTDKRQRRRDLMVEISDGQEYVHHAPVDSMCHAKMFVRLMRKLETYPKKVVPWDDLPKARDHDPSAIYASFDCEMDGPNLAHHSLRSIGVQLYDGRGERMDDTFYVHIAPKYGCQPDPDCMNDFWANNLEQWAYLQTNMVTPETAMRLLAEWLDAYSREKNVKWVAKPSNVDWMWLKSYYERYGPPHKPELGYYCHCIASLLKVYCHTHHVSPGFQDRLAEGEINNHNALQDAIRQGTMYRNIRRLLSLDSDRSTSRGRSYDNTSDKARHSHCSWHKDTLFTGQIPGWTQICSNRCVTTRAQRCLCPPSCISFSSLTGFDCLRAPSPFAGKMRSEGFLTTTRSTLTVS